MVEGTKGSKPTYDLGHAQDLVAANKFYMTRRVAKFIRDKWDDRPNLAVAEIFAAIRQSDFHKSIELDMLPGTFADVYFTEYGGETWYVKFYIDGGETMVQILSCNIDGYVH